MTTPRRFSREKRNSGRKSFTTANGIDHLSEVEFEELQKTIQRQEEDLVVYALREEIMARVMDECYRRYKEKQSVKLMVHCAHRALVQLVNFGCFNHDPGKPFYVNHPVWSPDLPPKPSAPDSWAAGIVPVKPKPIIPLPPRSSSEADLDKALVVVDKDTNIFEGITPASTEVEFLYINPSQSIDEEPIEDVDIKTETDLLVPQVSEVNDEIPKKSLSIFTLTTEMVPETLPQSIKSGRSNLKGLQLRTETRRQFKSILGDTIMPKLTPSQYSSLR